MNLSESYKNRLKILGGIINEHIELKAQEQQMKGLNIMKLIRTEIEMQGFMIDSKFSVNGTFESDLHNGVGTNIKIVVDYRSKTAEWQHNNVHVDVKLNTNKTYNDVDFNRGISGYTKFFNEIFKKISNQFENVSANINLYGKTIINF